MSATNRGASRDARLLILKRAFVDDALREAHELVRLLERGTGGSAAAGVFDACRKIAHDLRGAGGSYGFDEVTVAAGQVEDALLAGTAFSDVAVGARELLSVLASVHHRLAAATPGCSEVEEHAR